MTRIRIAGALLVTGMLAGCQPEHKQVAPPSPPPAQTIGVDQARAQFMQADPRALVGQVAEVMPERNLVALRDLPVQQFSLGDPVSLVEDNANLTSIGIATVENIVKDIIVVRYDQVSRPPRKGDFAVRMPGGQLNNGLIHGGGNAGIGAGGGGVGAGETTGRGAGGLGAQDSAGAGAGAGTAASAPATQEPAITLPADAANLPATQPADAATPPATQPIEPPKSVSPTETKATVPDAGDNKDAKAPADNAAKPADDAAKPADAVKPADDAAKPTETTKPADAGAPKPEDKGTDAGAPAPADKPADAAGDKKPADDAGKPADQNK